MTHLFEDFFSSTDAKLNGVAEVAAAGMSQYILPLGWAMLALSLLVYAFLIIEGKIQNPMTEWISRGIGMMLVLMASGSLYSAWVMKPLAAMPNQIAAAISGTSGPNAVLDTLTSALIDLIGGIGAGAVDAFAGWNIGGGLILVCALVDITVVGALLLVACAFNTLYAQLGLKFMLGVGPFFILCLFWPQFKNYFYSWLNTVLYFVFLAVMSAMFVTFFIGIAQEFMDAIQGAVRDLTAAGGASSYAVAVKDAIKAWATGTQAPGTVAAASSNFLNILSLTTEINLVFLTLFFVALELRTMVSSMTSGSGGSASSGVGNLVRMARGG